MHDAVRFQGLSHLSFINPVPLPREDFPSRLDAYSRHRTAFLCVRHSNDEQPSPSTMNVVESRRRSLIRHGRQDRAWLRELRREVISTHATSLGYSMFGIEPRIRRDSAASRNPKE